MAKFIRHTSCPKCGSRDNRAEYDDGSSFCFGCRDTGRGTTSGFVSERIHEDSEAEVSAVVLPEDSGHSFPDAAVLFLGKYGITIEEAIARGILWSERNQQLIYAYKDREGRIACVQGRNFDPDRAAKAKYFNRGSTAEVLPIYKATNGVRSTSNWNRRLVITEDALSAIRIARQCDAMPALGTNVPAHKIMALKASYEFITIWLDRDKWREAREIAEKCLWTGLSANTIYSDLDPKCYRDEEITKYLTNQ